MNHSSGNRSFLSAGNPLSGHEARLSLSRQTSVIQSSTPSGRLRGDWSWYLGAFPLSFCQGRLDTRLPLLGLS